MGCHSGQCTTIPFIPKSFENRVGEQYGLSDGKLPSLIVCMVETGATKRQSPLIWEPSNTAVMVQVEPVYKDFILDPFSKHTCFMSGFGNRSTVQANVSCSSVE
jgi:hypothetical protein